MPRWSRRCLRFLRSIVRPLLRPIRSVVGWDGFWWVIGMVGALAIGVFLWCFWEELRGDQDSLSTTIRNLALVIGGAIAILIAWWRSKVAERQADTAQQRLLNERYERGAEMLGSEVLSVRLGGIYALERLAAEHPERYHVQVMKLFCAFVRNPTEDAGSEEGVDVEGKPPHVVAPLREDVQAVMEVIGKRRVGHLALEGKDRFRLDLHGSDLRGAQLEWANLASAPWTDWTGVSEAEIFTYTDSTDLSEARLCSARLAFAKLSKANLSGACVCRAWLTRTDLSGADLTDASVHGALRWGPIVSGTRFSSDGMRPARDMVQSELDICVADPDGPPQIGWGSGRRIGRTAALER